MTEQIKNIIDRLETYIKKAEETGDKDDFINPAFEVLDELNGIENNFEAIEPILLLIERSPDIDYGGRNGRGLGPLGSFLEGYSFKGYEHLLIKSIERKPTVYTLHLLHRAINDLNDHNHVVYLYLMKKIASSIEYPENVIEDAKYSVSYFEHKFNE